MTSNSLKSTLNKLSFVVLFFVVLFPVFAIADAPLGFTPIVGVPGVNSTTANFDTYIDSLYALSISIAALLAVVKIVIAGVKWMTTDIVSSKGEAKKDIEGSLLGLIIVLGAVLILTTINSSLVNVDLSFTSQSTPVYTAATSPPTGPTYTPAAGDHEVAMSSTNETLQRAECENRREGTSYGFNRCGTGAHCYVGVFYDLGGPIANNKCIVSETNFVKGGDEFPCIGSPGAYDCIAAANKCADARLLPTDSDTFSDVITLDTDRIECKWP